MGSPLGPVLTGIFMVELEIRIPPTLGNTILNQKRFVDETIGYVKNGGIDIILSKLNSFHPNIQFTCEVEEENKLSFLDDLLIRNENFIENKLFRIPTNDSIYLNWNIWTRSTLRTLIKRACLIFTLKKHLGNQEISGNCLNSTE